MRKGHSTEFFLYNVDTFLLCGDVSVDRTKNHPVDKFMKNEETDMFINGKEIRAT